MGCIRFSSQCNECIPGRAWVSSPPDSSKEGTTCDPIGHKPLCHSLNAQSFSLA